MAPRAFGKTRDPVAEVGGKQFGPGTYRAGQKAAAEGQKRHETDAQTFQQRQNPGLNPARPQRIFTLQRRKWCHGTGAGNGGRPGFRQAPMRDFAGGDQRAHGARDIRDRHRRIDADGSTRFWYKRSIISTLRRRKEPSTARRIVSGRLSTPRDGSRTAPGTSSGKEKPNLEAILT